MKSELIAKIISNIMAHKIAAGVIAAAVVTSGTVGTVAVVEHNQSKDNTEEIVAEKTDESNKTTEVVQNTVPEPRVEDAETKMDEPVVVEEKKTSKENTESKEKISDVKEQKEETETADTNTLNTGKPEYRIDRFDGKEYLAIYKQADGTFKDSCGNIYPASVTGCYYTEDPTLDAELKELQRQYDVLSSEMNALVEENNNLYLLGPTTDNAEQVAEIYSTIDKNSLLINQKAEQQGVLADQMAEKMDNFFIPQKQEHEVYKAQVRQKWGFAGTVEVLSNGGEIWHKFSN